MATGNDTTRKAAAVHPSVDIKCVDRECPICYQLCVHPVRLPCKHVFCYLCAKGVVHRTRRCAMCRQPVDPLYLESPELLDSTHLDITNEKDKILWFYQARSRGWWLYEKRLATEIEHRYQQNEEDTFDVQIAGYIYTIDLHDMVQYRKDNSNIRRAIKRDLITRVGEVKGNAGLRLTDNSRHGDRSAQEGDPISNKTDSITNMVSQLSLSQSEDVANDDSSDSEVLV